MRFLAFFLCAAAFGAIDGTVNNRSTGKPQPGATVRLFWHGQGAGPELVGSTKSDNEGRFSFAQDAAGATFLIEAVHGGVTYTTMLPEGVPAGGVELEVYDSSTKPGAARVQQRIVLLEPGESRLAVSETFFLTNPGNVTWHDPSNGTLRFFVPAEGKESLRVMATAPRSMPVERAPQETGETGVYKLSFPVKPGETRIDVSYTVPFTPPGPFSGRTLVQGAPTRIIVPHGVTLTGEGLTQLGIEPSTQAAIFETAAQAFSVNLEGTGDEGGPSIQAILPRIYDRVVWLLTPAFLALGLGFILLYRRGPERG